MGIGIVIYFFHLVATAYMTGAIWVIQTLQYPLFRLIDPAHFQEGMRRHQKGTMVSVLPMMTLELLSACALSVGSVAVQIKLLWWVSVLLLLIIWLLTGFLFMPLHQRLTEGAQPEEINKLILWNWTRLALWTVRLILLLIILLF